MVSNTELTSCVTTGPWATTMLILSSWLIMWLGITWEGESRELVMNVHWNHTGQRHVSVSKSAIMWLVFVSIVNWYRPSYFCAWIYLLDDVFPKLGDWMSSKSRFGAKLKGGQPIMWRWSQGLLVSLIFCVWSSFAWARVMGQLDRSHVQDTAQWRVGDLYAWMGDCPAF